jgi:hypothetical protein
LKIPAQLTNLNPESLKSLELPIVLVLITLGSLFLSSGDGKIEYTEAFE